MDWSKIRNEGEGMATDIAKIQKIMRQPWTIIQQSKKMNNFVEIYTYQD